MLSAKQTTNLASTNKTTLSNLCISIPSIIEQYKIVYQLSRVTDVFQRQIKIIEYEINTIHEYKTRIIIDVVTGKRDVFL